MRMEHFERLVEEALEELPSEVKGKMENVAVCLEDLPDEETLEEEGFYEKELLLGIYQGVPQGAWGRGFGDNLPDKITIFKSSIERVSRSDEEVKSTIKRTVYHEIAHHFGFNEEEARKMEKTFYEEYRDNK